MATKTTKADREAKIQYLKALREMLHRRARAHLLQFTLYTMPQFNPADFHARYYEVLTRFARGEVRKLMVFVPPQHGKLLPANTPILTTKGFKSHGELKRGDYVFGDDGKPKRVLRNFGVYPWHVERVQFSGDVSLLAAREHLWKIYADYDDHKGRREVIQETQEIFGRRHRRSPYIAVAPALEMPKQDLPIDPYILGVWLGDGLSRQGVIIIGEQDISHFEGLGQARRTKEGAYRILIEGLSKLLRLEGLILNKHIPTKYLLSSKEQRTRLLQGLMDTDGYVSKRGECEFTQMKGRLADDVYILLRSLGYKARKKEYIARLDNRDVGQKVRIFFNPSKGDEVFTLPRKVEKIEEKNRSDRADKYKYFIQSIEPYGVVEGNCIEVEGGMYLAGYDLIPTHNSEGSTRRLPAFILGQNPDTRVAIVSYNASKARKFNREIQRVIDTPEYASLFPETRLNASNVTTVAGSWLRNADECEIVGHLGGFKTVGVGGALTGEPVDVLIMDDIYKDAKTAWSPTVREAVSDWYDTVAETRLHNGSRQLIVFTRWHEDDLAGKLLREQGIYHPTDNPKGWVVVSYPAIKVGAPTEDDPRSEGAPLWAERHSLDKLEDVRRRSPHTFESLYQQDPKPQEGLLYAQGFRTYESIPRGAYHLRRAYVDTADTGADYLCAILYEETDTAVYVLDVLYTQKPMEETEPRLAELLTKWEIKECFIESNNGGRGFARNVEGQLRRGGNHKTRITPFTQTANKATRILVHSASVQNMIHMPVGWERNFHEFATALSGYIKAGKNPHDDAPDALTGIIERLRGSDRARLSALF